MFSVFSVFVNNSAKCVDKRIVLLTTRGLPHENNKYCYNKI